MSGKPVIPYGTLLLLGRCEFRQATGGRCIKFAANTREEWADGRQEFVFRLCPKHLQEYDAWQLTRRSLAATYSAKEKRRNG